MRVVLGSRTPAVLALPDRPVERGVVLAPDVFGLRPLVEDLCHDLAGRHGWAVCAPEPFPGRESLSLRERLDGIHLLRDEEQLADLAAAAAELRLRSGVSRVAVLGFCLGGMYALKAADLGAFDKVVTFYGMIRLPAAFRGPGHREPLEALASADAAPVLAIVGGRDPATPSDDIAALEAAGATVACYPEAEHAFVHETSRPSHRPEDAADAWRRATAFLAD